MVVLANYCAEVYIVLTYKSVKSVVEVSRCKFAVCIVTILDIIPFTERVANNCFENEVRQSENAKIRPSTSDGSTKNNDSNFAMCGFSCAPTLDANPLSNIGHRSTLSFAMCGFPTPPTFDPEPTKKNAAR